MHNLELHPRPSVVAAQIEPRDDGTFAWSKDGRWALTIGVYDRDERLVDFVAYFRTEPGKWFLRRRTESPVLGASMIARAADLRQPLKLYAMPYTWLLARGDGAAVIDWSPDLRGIFDQVPSIHCQNSELKDRLDRHFAKFQPKITAPPRSKRHAA